MVNLSLFISCQVYISKKKGKKSAKCHDIGKRIFCTMCSRVELIFYSDTKVQKWL